MSDTIPVKAGGNILPCRFIALSADFTVVQSSDDQVASIGVTAESSESAPGSLDPDGYHARAGDPVQYYPAGKECLLEVGDSVAAGAYLMTDANGKGITATSGNYANFQAYEAGGGDGEKVRGKVIATFPVP